MGDAREPPTITGSQAIRQVYRGGDGMELEPVGPVVRCAHSQPPPEAVESDTPIIDAWRAAGEPAMFTASVTEDGGRLLSAPPSSIARARASGEADLWAIPRQGI